MPNSLRGSWHGHGIGETLQFRTYWNSSNQIFSALPFADTLSLSPYLDQCCATIRNATTPPTSSQGGSFSFITTVLIESESQFSYLISILWNERTTQNTMVLCKFFHDTHQSFWVYEIAGTLILRFQQGGVSHCVTLPFAWISILRQNKNYENSNISPCKNIIFKKSSKRNKNNLSKYYNSVTNLKFQH
jgi:hypothetical protein